MIFLLKNANQPKRKLFIIKNHQEDQEIKKYLIDHVNSKSKFHNIKDYFLISKYFKFASSKNLCLGLGINYKSDCLKWKWELFEKIKGEFCYCKNDDKKGLCTLYSLINNQYYFPVSEIAKYPNINLIVNLPNLKIEYEELFTLYLPKNLLTNFQPQSDYAKYDGVISEAMIAESLKAKNVKEKNVKDWKFLNNNKKKLNKIGEFSYEPTKENE